MKKWIVNELRLELYENVKKTTVFDTLEKANEYAKKRAKEELIQNYGEGLYMGYHFDDFDSLIQVIEIEIKC